MATSSLSAIDDVTMTVIVKFKSGSTISTIWSVTCDVVNVSSRVEFSCDRHTECSFLGVNLVISG